MDIKKSPKANLEKKRFGFFQLGIVIAMAVTLVAFEWKTFEKFEVASSEIEFEMVEFDLPPVLQQPQPQQEKRVVDLTLPPIIDPNPQPDPLPPIDPNPQPPIDPCVDCPPIVLDTAETYVASPYVEFIVVEDMPEFIGGIAALKSYLEENLRYPGVAREQEIQGKVWVEFVVGTDGSIFDVSLKDDYDIGGGCGKEAIRVVESMPNWIPGKQRGQAVNVRYTLPVTFKLK